MQANSLSPFIVEGVRILCKDGGPLYFKRIRKEVWVCLAEGSRSPYVVLNYLTHFPANPTHIGRSAWQRQTSVIRTQSQFIKSHFSGEKIINYHFFSLRTLRKVEDGYFTEMCTLTWLFDPSRLRRIQYDSYDLSLRYRNWQRNSHVTTDVFALYHR